MMGKPSTTRCIGSGKSCVRGRSRRTLWTTQPVPNSVIGLIEFDLACVPSLVFPDNVNNPLGGTPRLFFDGGAGADADVLNFTLTENGSTQTYAIGAGAGPGAGDGEVYTTNAAGRSLTTYFHNLGPAPCSETSMPTPSRLPRLPA